MKQFRIINEINGNVCTVVSAAHERSALRKFHTGLLSAGFYNIIIDDDKRPRLISSFGSCFRADAV